MPRLIHVHLLPSLVPAGELAGSTAVVIDVLRATTTITQALAAGAKEVIPCQEIDEARQLAAQIGPTARLGGERGGKKIDGFHFGNSPEEYTRESVGGKTLVFTTTNGTRAMKACRAAKEILLASFLNLSAICSELAGVDRLHIVCAGTDQQITREDVLVAGAIVDELVVGPEPEFGLNDQAAIALDAWREARTNLTTISLADRMRACLGGRNLIDIGQEHDIEIAAQIDRLDVVPRLDPASGGITKG